MAYLFGAKNEGILKTYSKHNEIFELETGQRTKIVLDSRVRSSIQVFVFNIPVISRTS